MEDRGRATYTSRVCAVALVAVRAFADDLAVDVPALGTVSGYRLWWGIEGSRVWAHTAWNHGRCCPGLFGVGLLVELVLARLGDS